MARSMNKTITGTKSSEPRGCHTNANKTTYQKQIHKSIKTNHEPKHIMKPTKTYQNHSAACVPFFSTCVPALSNCAMPYQNCAAVSQVWPVADICL